MNNLDKIVNLFLTGNSDIAIPLMKGLDISVNSVVNFIMDKYYPKDLDFNLFIPIENSFVIKSSVTDRYDIIEECFNYKSLECFVYIIGNSIFLNFLLLNYIDFLPCRCFDIELQEGIEPANELYSKEIEKIKNRLKYRIKKLYDA